MKRAAYGGFGFTQIPHNKSTHNQTAATTHQSSNTQEQHTHAKHNMDSFTVTLQ